MFFLIRICDKIENSKTEGSVAEEVSVAAVCVCLCVCMNMTVSWRAQV